MQVEDLYNYGQDIFSMRENSQVPPLEKLKLLPAFLSYYGNLVRLLGLPGILALRQEVLREFELWRQQDWSHLQQRGLSQENLERILKEMSMAKVLAGAIGLKKAAHLRRRLSSRVADAVLQAVFAPPEVFIVLGDGDFLPPFKKYYAALLDAMEREGLQSGSIVEDNPDLLQVNITYCAWAEVAKVMGNPLYCYYSTCYGDEVFFPKLAAVAGFQFERYGTLGQGESSCDHLFRRAADNPNIKY
jgi:hypothetical protein